MSLQKKIIEQYKSAYPGQSLGQISNTTGIQVTRVFRLFKGATMRLREYEAIYQAILKKQVTAASLDCEFLYTAQKAVSTLSSTTINDLSNRMNHLIRISSISKQVD